MSFDWMHADVPAAVAASGEARFKDALAAEIRDRAALLRRLGHTRAYAELRCRRNVTWAFDGAGTSPLSDDEVAALVGEIYRG